MVYKRSGSYVLAGSIVTHMNKTPIINLQLPILCIAGPTASGKSNICTELAKRWPVEIINVDSATIYKGMDIGTAKPSKDERAIIKHHLLDIRDPAESYSAAAFRQDALSLISSITNRGNIPVLCGGTMLYYKALREGLSELPGATPETRAQIDAEAQLLGWPALHAQLAKFDPHTASRLKPTDSQRLQRAIEIYRTTGISMSDWLAQNPPQKGHDLNLITLSLEPSQRCVLHKRIEQRYQIMLENGLLHEVETLHARGDLHTGLPSVRCVGYRQLWGYLEGEYSLNVAVNKAIAATRQLAKRQLTWLRSQPERKVIDSLDKAAATKTIDFMAQLHSSS